MHANLCCRTAGTRPEPRHRMAGLGTEPYRLSEEPLESTGDQVCTHIVVLYTGTIRDTRGLP